MSSSKVSIHEVKSITECSICTDVMNTPKILPCLHTFCLKCIEQIGEDKQEGEAVPCPMCRTAFNIPVGGLSKLNNNFFIEKLIASQSSSDCSKVNKICDVCFTGKQTKQVAVSFCVECEENLCEQCSCIHKSMKATKSHEVKLVTAVNQETDNPKTSQEICDIHQEEIKFYCDECKSVCCKKCVEDNHNHHECFDIDETIEDLNESLKSDCKGVKKLLTSIEMKSEAMGETFYSLKKDSEDAKEQIKERGESLKKIIDKHVEHALERVTDFESKLAKRYEILKDQSLRKIVDARNFIKYCEEVLCKASPTELFEMFYELHSKAQDLNDMTVMEFERYPEFTFSPSDFEIIDDGITSSNNIIGTCFEKLQVSRGVQGVAASDKHFYVLYSKSPDIEVYDAKILTYQETISISDLYDPSDIVYNGKHLFVSDREDQTIKRIELLDKTVKKFKVAGRPMALSSTRDGSVIVTSSDPLCISEYTIDSNDFSALRPKAGKYNCLYHTISLTEFNSYLACCAKDSCNPSVIRIGGKPELLFDGETIGSPCYFAIAKDKSVLIADRNGNQVLKADVEEKEIVEVVLPQYVGLNRPFKICLHEKFNQLYVCEYGHLDKISIFEI